MCARSDEAELNGFDSALSPGMTDRQTYIKTTESNLLNDMHCTVRDTISVGRKSRTVKASHLLNLAHGFLSV